MQLGNDVLPVAGAGTTQTRRFDGLWWATFALLATMGVLWALTLPLFAGPDEAAHTVRAVAVARGQFDPGERPPNRPGGQDPAATVPGGGEVFGTDRLRYSYGARVPESFRDATEIGDCVALARIANCPRLTGARDLVTVYTAAGSYPPAYYAVVGVPGVLFPSSTGVYLMRIVHAVLCAALVASAVVAVVRHGRNRFVLVGIAIAVTPLAMSLFAVVNPSGLEISAAILFWTATGALLLADGADVPRRLLVRVAVGGALLALSRAGSPLWVFLIVAALVCLADPARLRALLVHRDVRIVAAIITVACAVQLLWAARYDSFTGLLGAEAPSRSFASNLRTSLGYTNRYLEEMIVQGVAPDLRPALANLSVHLWLFVGAAITMLGFACANARERAVLLALVVLTIFIPVVSDVQHGGTYPWAGRYTLPLAMGIPIVATMVTNEDRVLSRRVVAAFGRGALVLLLIAQVYFIAWTMHRYTVGIDGPLDFVTRTGWSPPLPTWLLLIGFAGAAGAAAWGADRRLRGDGVDLPTLAGVGRQK